MTTNLLLTGGPYHVFDANSRLIAGMLERDGIHSEITDDLEDGFARLAEFDLLTVNFLRWRMRGDMFDDVRGQWAGSLSAAGRDAFLEHLGRGKGVLALHTAAICFDDWPEWGEVIGARWNWTRSSHPPPRATPIDVRTGEHPIVADVEDFEVIDELYSFLDCADIAPLMTADRRSEPQPLLLAREVRGGRVVYDALGHDERSLTDATHARVIRRAAAWAVGGS